MTGLRVGLRGAPRRVSAAARAAGPGGMRSLRRCGRAAAAASSRRLQGGDVAVIADHGPGAVRGEPVPGDHYPCAGGDVRNGAPSNRDTVTVAAASSGGTEYQLPR